LGKDFILRTPPDVVPLACSFASWTLKEGKKYASKEELVLRRCVACLS